MIQCFLKKKYDLRDSCFLSGAMPRLVALSSLDADYSRDHPRILHRHDDVLEVMLIHSGCGTYMIDQTRYQVQKGDVLVFNQGILHDENSSTGEGIDAFCCIFSDVHLKGLPENWLIPAGRCPVLHAGELFSPVYSIMETLHALLHTENQDIAESCTYLGSALLSLVLQSIRLAQTQQETPPSKDDALCLRIKAYIDAHYNEEISLKRIGDAIRINPYYLSHVFKNKLGYSPMQYVSRRRLGEAQSLLINTDLSVTEISAEVGYNNTSHFYSIFLKYNGMSPRDYRKQYTENHKKP